VITEKDFDLQRVPVPGLAFTPKVQGMPWKGLTLRKIVQQSVAAVEKEVIGEALKYTGGNKAKAARLLGIDYKTIHEKVKKFGISGSVNTVFGQIGNEDGNGGVQTGSTRLGKDVNEHPDTSATPGT
jgi:ABC-type xylose transport system permease subunit